MIRLKLIFCISGTGECEHIFILLSVDFTSHDGSWGKRKVKPCLSPAFSPDNNSLLETCFNQESSRADPKTSPNYGHSPKAIFAPKVRILSWKPPSLAMLSLLDNLWVSGLAVDWNIPLQQKGEGGPNTLRWSILWKFGDFGCFFYDKVK